MGNITDPVDPANNNTVIPEVCDRATGSITVLDELTRQPILGARVNVVLQSNAEDEEEIHEIVTNQLSSAEGKVVIPMTLNGNYLISVEKEDYNEGSLQSQVSCHMDECDSCTLDVTIGMELTPTTTTTTTTPCSVQEVLLANMFDSLTIESILS